MENVVIRGVSLEKSQAKVTVRAVPDKPGSAAAIFNAIAAQNIIIDMIVQSASAGATNDISFTMSRDEFPKTKAVLEAVVKEIGAGGLETNEGMAKLSIIGVGMRSHGGVAAKMFEALSRAGVNIEMISTSEIKTAVIIEESKLNEAANVVHEAFGLGAATAS
jgi:aspartate kinase